MRKVIAASVAGLVLVAGQAAASNVGSTELRVGDRLGARANAESELVGVPLFVLIAGGIVLSAVIYNNVIKDDSDSD